MRIAASEKQKRSNRIQANANVPADLAGFIAWMKDRGKPVEIIRSALKGKFPNLSDEEADVLLK